MKDCLFLAVVFLVLFSGCASNATNREVSTNNATSANVAKQDARERKTQFDIFMYIKYVFDPTAENIGSSVQLENDAYLLLQQPDMVYTLLDKKTGVTTTGMYTFVMHMV